MTDIKEYFADCYVLTDQRNKEHILRFLDHFIPDRKETADEYEVPRYSTQPSRIFRKAENLISYLSENKSEPHGIYWSNTQEGYLRNAQVFFTNDGYLILGISCYTKYPNTEIEESFHKELLHLCSSEYGYITYEDIPPLNSLEFKKKVAQ
ncbi:MAG: hypothetical protein JJ978_14700 [Roseivirga sp.]|uniref:hypothetical protein n=1 Tax=Roseivirga sp. TaxID=1964215 RepID=UPI001B0A3F39|nr:hypothetical protein [Roseivirga sp.]MBO6496816.1 hypothetical protein [Roseivirga sp.]